MTNATNVTKLIREDDFNVFVTTFDNTSRGDNTEGVYNEWLQTIYESLGNCISSYTLHIIQVFTPNEHILTTGAICTEDVKTTLLDCFDSPETFRIDIITPHETTFSWIFALASDLKQSA